MRFIVGDTETTGPKPDDKVVEIAWVEVDEGLAVVDRVHSLIDPEMHIPAAASGIHRITDADVVHAPTIKEFFYELMDDPLQGDVCLIAHNVQFDRRYFSPFISNLVAELCTLRLARRLWPEAENHKLQTLMFELDLDRGTSHRADGDVDTTVDLLRKIVERSGKSLLELAAESMEPVLVEVMPFGKHKGKKLLDLPKDYVKWLLNLDNLDRDMRWSLERL
jgi:exodeoxyribonuclease X